MCHWPSVGIGSVPDRGGFGAGLVLAIDGEADALELVGNVIADVLALVLGADDA